MLLPQSPTMTRYIQAATLLGCLSLIACAYDDFVQAWYIVWRIASGICGGLIMILAPSIVAQCCDLKDRLQINFIGFSGIGFGVLLATLFLPYLDRISTQSAWFILAAFSILISMMIWFYLNHFKSKLANSKSNHSNKIEINAFFISLLAVYGASAFAYVPHSLFWIDYLTEVLDLSLYWININWILYGLGSAFGAFTSFVLARRFGNITALKILYSCYIFAVFIAIFKSISFFTLISSFLTGLLNPAVVFLTSYTILMHYTDSYKTRWSLATILFALIQLIGGLSFSGLQILGINYDQQFLLASLVLFIGTAQFFWFTKDRRKIENS